MAIFDNFLIQAPDGQNLSRCGRKKLNWYINNGLADLVSEDPPTIRLKFEPSGREGATDPLIVGGKPNMCVVCGSTEDLTRHHIIPYSFIKYMKVEYKADIIRDICPLCVDCHNEYEKKSFEKRQEISDRFDCPIAGKIDGDMRAARKAAASACALLDYKDNIPLNRKKYLEKTVAEFLGKDHVNEDDLQYVKCYKWGKTPDYVNFSKHVAENVEDYSEFAKEWRTHFVETMQPKYMPKAWKVDRKTENLWVPERMKRQAQAKTT